MELKKTPFHDIHVKLGAKMTNFAGYDMPIQYPDGIVAEHMAVLESVGVFDVSHMGALFVSGPKAEEFLQNVCSNDISKLEDGKAQYNYYPMMRVVSSMTSSPTASVTTTCWSPMQPISRRTSSGSPTTRSTA